MNERDPIYHGVFIVLMDAGMAGAAIAFSTYYDTGTFNGGMSALAALCLPSAAMMVPRVVTITRTMQRSSSQVLRRVAVALWFALLISFVGSTILAILGGTPGAILDISNDILACVGFGLLTLSVIIVGASSFIFDSIGAVVNRRSRRLPKHLICFPLRP